MRVTAEMRPRILVGMAEIVFGQGIPEVGLRREQGNFRSRLSFFFSGKVFGDNWSRFPYDSQRPINPPLVATDISTGSDRSRLPAF